MKLEKSSPLLLVGAGKMGGAMLAGWVEQGIDPAAIVVCDPRPSEEMATLLAAKGIRHVTSVPGDLTPAVVLVAVKPQMMAAALEPLKPVVGTGTLVVSIAAGKTIETFEAAFGGVPVVRAMPNTPAQVGRGMTAVFANAAVSADQKHLVEDLLSGIGAVAWLGDEGEMDAVTAVSGSGPAYVFLLAECLAEAGRKAGLSPETCRNACPPDGGGCRRAALPVRARCGNAAQERDVSGRHDGGGPFGADGRRRLPAVARCGGQGCGGSFARTRLMRCSSRLGL